MNLRELIRRYQPVNEQEACDQASMLTLLESFPHTILLRENTAAHMTSSGFIVNSARTKALLIHHGIYHAWGWTGGHADGDTDLLRVALREAAEETGVAARPLSREIASLDILPVCGHMKRGRYVSAHLHLSAAYLLVADEAEPLCRNSEENSGARWAPLDELAAICAEPHMLPVYEKLRGKARKLHAEKR